MCPVQIGTSNVISLFIAFICLIQGVGGSTHHAKLVTLTPGAAVALEQVAIN